METICSGLSEEDRVSQLSHRNDYEWIHYSKTFLKGDVCMTSFLIKGISTKARYFCWKSWVPYLFLLTFMFRVFLHTQPRTFILGFLVEPLLHSQCIRRRSPRAFSFPSMWVTYYVFCVSTVGFLCLFSSYSSSVCNSSRFPILSSLCNKFRNGCPGIHCNIRSAFLVCGTVRFLCEMWYISLYSIRILFIPRVFPCVFGWV